ncbi:MAG: type 1 glutamine amidotransferase domain-containing protein [Poseidonibacter sp.]
MNILIVLTSHDKLGNTDNKTGFWLEEFASPYYTLLDAGANITIASPKGGQPPLDPTSDLPDFQTDFTKRFKEDEKANEVLANTLKLSNVIESDFDAIIYPGGHGPLWDLTNDENSISLIQDFVKANKPVAAVCHAPSVLLNVKLEDGEYLVNNKKVTAFSNTEEEAVQLTNVVPFLLEDALQEKGAIFSKTDDWNSYVITDGKLITGQNPASSEAVAKELLKLLS